jgi:hypothetical protein
MMADTTNSLNSAVDDLVKQLQGGVTSKKDTETGTLDRDNLEKFLFSQAEKLIKGSVEMVADVQQYVAGAPTPEDVSALATLIGSSAAAIETLNKVMISNKNIEAKFKLKQMDIDSRKELQQNDFKGKLLMNREELLKKLIDDSKTINVEVTQAQEVPKTALEDKIT